MSAHWTIAGAALLLAAVLFIIGRKTGVLVRGSAGGHAAPRRAQAGEWDQPAPSQPPAGIWPVSRETEGSADLDQFLPAGLYPQTLAPLPDREQWQPHHAPDAPEGRVHDGCEISDTGQQAALTLLSERYDAPAACIRANRKISDEKRAELGERFREAFSRRDQAICLCGKVPGIPGEPITSEARCPAHGTELPPAGAAVLGTRPGEDGTRMCRDCASGYCGRAMCKPDDDCACPCSTWAKPLNCPCCVDGDALRCCICERNCGSSDCRCRPAPDDTVTDMRPVPATVAARENAAARWSLRAHVSHVIAWKPPLRAWVDDVIGTSPAEDWDRLLEQARAGAVSDGG